MRTENLPVIAPAQVRPDWLAAYQEPTLDPELPIIDPHHHFSDTHWGGYSPDDLLRDTGSGHNVVSTVYIQVGYGYRSAGPEKLRPIGETEKVVALSNSANSRQRVTQVCAGMVGYADLTHGAAVDEVFAAHSEKGQGRMRGIRCGAAAHAKFRYGVMPTAPLHLYEHPGFRAGYARLAKWGLSFDSWAYHTQLEELYQLASAFPETSVVIDHIGVPLGVGPYTGKRAEVFDEWRRQMARIATLPNVCVKLGGLGMSVFGFDHHLRPAPPSSLELANAWGPYIRACIDLFGPARCMFESNFPVDKGSCSYRVLWNAFKRIASGMSSDEKRLLFMDTAAHVYRI